jgi:hypothetical protein
MGNADPYGMDTVVSEDTAVTVAFRFFHFLVRFKNNP